MCQYEILLTDENLLLTIAHGSDEGLTQLGQRVEGVDVEQVAIHGVGG